MARHMLLKHHPVTLSHVGFGIGTLVLCAFALFMCASHSRRWRHKWRSACYGYGNQDPVIELDFGEEIPGYHFEEMDPSSYSGEGTLWKKNILMGGKCQLPEFSGVIIYDSTGNVVTPAKPRQALPALPWK